MMSSRCEPLIAATITEIQDTNVIYPYCTVCFSKLNESCHLNKWICMQCQSSYKSDCIPYRYCLRFNVADETSSCSMSVFGKTLQPYFGLDATEMQRILHLQHSNQIMEALKKTFVGKCFVFQLKTPLLHKEDSSNLCLLSVIKKQDNSLFGSNLVASKIISNKSTDNDTVYSYLMQYNQLTHSKKRFEINKLHSLQTTEMMDFESSALCSILKSDSLSYESIVLSWETKESECQKLKIPITALYSNKSSSTILFDSTLCQGREVTFTDKEKSLFSFDEYLNREPNQSQFLFTETSVNIKTDFKNKSKVKEISCPYFENISISEIHKDDDIKNFGNIVDQKKKAISFRSNENRKGLCQSRKAENLSSILYDFHEIICDEYSLKFIDTCKKNFKEKSKSILCPANSSSSLLEDVNNFMNEYSELNNCTDSLTAYNLSMDLFETISEKTSNSSKKLCVSNHSQIFLKSSTPHLQNKTDTISFYRNKKKSLSLCSHTPNKHFCHLHEDSKDIQVICSTQPDIDEKSHLSLMIPTSNLQTREKQKEELKTVFSQNNMNKQTVTSRQNASYQYSNSIENKENIRKCMSKTHFICLPFKFCTSPASPIHKLSSKSFSISKIKTKISQKTFASTPITKSSFLKNVPFFISAKDCSPSLYDSFGTPIQRTDFIKEDIYCASPSLQQNESPDFHGFVRETPPEENNLSLDLFASSNDSNKMLSLSLQISATKANDFSQDLFSSKSHQSSISSTSNYLNKNSSMTPLSLKSSRDQHLTPQKKLSQFDKEKYLTKSRLTF